jgi:hypothetical protein
MVIFHSDLKDVDSYFNSFGMYITLNLNERFPDATAGNILATEGDVMYQKNTGVRCPRW